MSRRQKTPLALFVLVCTSLQCSLLFLQGQHGVDTAPLSLRSEAGGRRGGQGGGRLEALLAPALLS